MGNNHVDDNKKLHNQKYFSANSPKRFQKNLSPEHLWPAISVEKFILRILDSKNLLNFSKWSREERG